MLEMLLGLLMSDGVMEDDSRMCWHDMTYLLHSPCNAEHDTHDISQTSRAGYPKRQKRPIPKAICLPAV